MNNAEKLQIEMLKIGLGEFDLRTYLKWGRVALGIYKKTDNPEVSELAYDIIQQVLESMRDYQDDFTDFQAAMVCEFATQVNMFSKPVVDIEYDVGPTLLEIKNLTYATE